MLLFGWEEKAALPMTHDDSGYRPYQMTMLNVSNKTLFQIYRDMFVGYSLQIC